MIKDARFSSPVINESAASFCAAQSTIWKASDDFGRLDALYSLNDRFLHQHNGFVALFNNIIASKGYFGAIIKQNV